MEKWTGWQHAPCALGGWQRTELQVATPMALASQWALIPADHKAINTNTFCVRGETQVTGDETQRGPRAACGFSVQAQRQEFKYHRERK